MATSQYIRAMHPKTGIRPDPASIQKILSLGWAAQLKIHGHRAQIHISCDPNEEILVFNRKGQLHGLSLSESMVKELRRLFGPSKDRTVIDAEWIKPQKKLFLFDVLKEDGKLLRNLSYEERWKKLPRSFISPHIHTLPLIRDLKGCQEALKSRSPYVEGLVFKSLKTCGFRDTSIIRCRRTA